VSENFVNDASVGTITASTSTREVSQSARATTLSFSYNASSGTYTVSEGSRSQSFSSANVDASQSNPLITTYARTTGNTTDYLALSKEGTGPGQTRYVGAGFWQRQVNGSSAVNGYFDAFTYGVRTSAASIPHSGVASFDVTLLGAMTADTTVSALSGTGRLDADFDSGAIYLKVDYQRTDLDSGLTNYGGVVQATAMIKVGTSQFAGTLGTNTTQFDGGVSEIHGSFYGPAAEEVGAAFSSSGRFAAMVGAIWGGRNSYPLNQISQFNSFGNAVFYKTHGSSTAVTLDANGKVVSSVADSPIVAKYADVSSQGLLYRTGTRVILSAPQGGAIDGKEETVPNLYGTQRAAVAAGLLFDRGGTSAVFDSYVYGLETANAAVPRTGAAYYTASIGGGVMEQGLGPETLNGLGTLAVDLSAGTLTGSGTYTFSSLDSSNLILGSAMPIETDRGTWSTNAKIASASNGISGTFALGGGKKAFSGSLDARFYGDAADQIGGPFALTSASGDRTSGFLLAAIDPSQTASVTPLSAIASPTLLATTGSASLFEYNKDVDLYFDETNGGDADFTTVALDPTSPDARIRVSPGVAVGAADRSAALSDATRDVYVKDESAEVSSGTLSGRVDNYVFDGQGNRIALTYSSFLTYRVIHSFSNFEDVRTDYLSYGQGTDKRLMPRSGSASYTGVAYAEAIVNRRDATGSRTSVYELSGASSLQADFSAGTVSGKVALAGTGVGGEPRLDFGQAQFSGSIGSRLIGSGEVGSFSAVASSGDLQGKVKGLFYGPTAREVGGSFDFTYAPRALSDPDNYANGTIRGAFAATSGK
jgi:hypothetical protein